MLEIADELCKESGSGGLSPSAGVAPGAGGRKGVELCDVLCSFFFFCCSFGQTVRGGGGVVVCLRVPGVETGAGDVLALLVAGMLCILTDLGGHSGVDSAVLVGIADADTEKCFQACT